MTIRRVRLFAVLLAGLLCLTARPAAAGTHAVGPAPARHVLLLSVDGLHALDLVRYARLNPSSAMARLAGMGVVYTNASTARPSDSFPGLLSMVTGGSPQSTGVWYDDSYDRALSAPGSACKTKGAEIVYDESIDKNSDALDAGGGIDPAKLPLDPVKGCTPVYPHSFLRVNTIFEVARAAGRRTAWSDKHPAYELLNGPSGHGVDDLYTPEIAAGGATDSVTTTEAYDDLKVAAILHQIDGKDHTGAGSPGTPAIFGMNFQAVSVGQKVPGAGYSDSQGTPSAGLHDALAHTDASIGKIVAELTAKGLLSSTVIVLTAKHGQAPSDPTKRQIVDKKIVTGLIDGVAKGLVAQATADDVALLWLTDQGKTAAAVAALQANQSKAAIQEILAGDALRLRYDDPRRDSRTPDIIVLPNLGVIYTKPSATKIAEHGGFSTQDTNVPILVAAPGMGPATVSAAVQTTQIAPTILQLLGLNPRALQAVTREHTPLLPGLTRAGTH